MLTLDERAELLVKVAELVRNRAGGQLLTLLSPLSMDELISEPELGLRLALTHFQFSHYEKAGELVDLLAEPCRRRGFDQLYRRRLNLEGNLNTELGDPDRAEAAYLEVLERSVAAGDQQWVAFATVNLGAIAGIRGEWMKAIAAAERAMTALQRIGDMFNLAACHQNLAMAYRELGLYSRADTQFDQALQLYRGSGFDVSLKLASLGIERAVSISAVGDNRRAEAMVRYALERLESLQASGYSLQRDVGEALRVLGIVMLAQKKFEAARGCLEAALVTARAENARLLQGEVFEALAELCSRQNQTDEADQWSRDAATIYESIGARARVIRLKARGLALAAG